MRPMPRNIIISGNDTVIPNATLPSGPLQPGSPTWPTPGGINETEAERICQKPIVMSPVFELCRNYTEDSLQVITDSCVLDVWV